MYANFQYVIPLIQIIMLIILYNYHGNNNFDEYNKPWVSDLLIT